MEMIATRVVEQQARVCATIMDAIKKDITELTRAVERFNARWDEQIPPLLTDVAVMKQRLTIVAAISGSLPVIVVLLFEFFKK